MPDALPLLPTTVVGSYALPSWVFAADDWMQRDLFGPIDKEETFNDAVDRAIQDQEKAGIDIISDGEMRRRGFVQGFVSKISGLKNVGAPRKAGEDRNRSGAGLRNNGARHRGRTAWASSKSSNICTRIPTRPRRLRFLARSPSPVGTSRWSITRTAANWPLHSFRHSRTRSGDLPPQAPNTSRSMSRSIPGYGADHHTPKDLAAMFNECIAGMRA